MAGALPSEEINDMVGPKGMINKVELVKSIAKSLGSLGYERSREELENESGIPLLSPVVNDLRNHVLDGNWDRSVKIVQEMAIIDEYTFKYTSFLIWEQNFFELMRNDEVFDALATLRSQIAPLGINKDRVHKLCRYIVSDPRCNLFLFANVCTEITESRSQLWEELQKFLPDIPPEERLESLVELALSLEMTSGSKYAQTTQVLQEHRDEVWFLQFSNNGRYLASSSKDGSIIIWEVKEGAVTLKHILNGHKRPVLMIAWSPDDCQLLSCGMEEVVIRWDVSTGRCLHVYRKDGVGLTFCSWDQEQKWILTGTTEDGIIRMWILDGRELSCLPWFYSENRGVVLTKDERWLITMHDEAELVLINTEDDSSKRIEETQGITSFSLSSDDKYLLVNVLNQECHLWNIEEDPELVMIYKGHKRSRYVIRSCFGGCDQRFVASGSEDSKVYIWHRDTGKLLFALPGHEDVVNCVSWNPIIPHMLASASDDHKIRIWRVEPEEGYL